MKFSCLFVAMLGMMVARTENSAGSPQDRGAIYLALAKTGDRKALQYFACQSVTTDVFSMESLMRSDIDKIGGGFAIEIYRQLLDSDRRFLPQITKMRKHRTTDTLPRLPSISVLFRLPSLLPEAGIPASPLLGYETDPTQDFGLRAKWRRWIEAHGEIKARKPTADGIRFDSDYCSEFAKTSR